MASVVFHVDGEPMSHSDTQYRNTCFTLSVCESPVVCVKFMRSEGMRLSIDFCCFCVAFAGSTVHNNDDKSKHIHFSVVMFSMCPRSDVV